MPRTTHALRRLRVAVLLLLGAASWSHTLAAQAPVTADDLSHLEWRPLGPAVTGGRIVDFAVPNPGSDTIYAAAAAGGVWKTTDRGVTWEGLFQDEDAIALGGLAVAPSNPNVLYAATGEPNARNMRSASWGNGVYRSDDGGRTWRHLGLEDSFQTGRVVVHPEDENTAWVSVVGSLWRTDPDRNAARGLWKTTDGGESWEKVLDAGEGVGVVEVALDPSDPDVLYAGAWDRERVEWRYLSTGPGSGIFRSTDGGGSWTRLTNGLPGGETGRPGISVCASRPDRVYAVLEGDGAGLYRSDDRGASWERVSEEVSSSMYYGQLRCDPVDPDRIYHLSTRLSVSEDGGRTFRHDLAGSSVHVDHHAMWIDPADPTRLVLGNDGGVYLSDDRGERWRFVPNLPISQFYNIAVDLQEPFYRVYGGTQDNNSLGGPSATRNTDGIVNADWFVTIGGDGFWLAPDPVEPWVVYTELQYGNVYRFDTRTGERRFIQPQSALNDAGVPGRPPAPEEELRWNWSTPILLSPHDHRTVYVGSQFLHRSRDRGDSWEVLGGDMTRNIEYENPMTPYGTIRAVAESPLRPGLLAVGTEDGLVQISEDDGATWRTVEGFPAPERFGGGTVPELHEVVELVLSAHDPDAIYLALNGHEFDDVRPYLVKSTDLGRSWTSITGDLPEGEAVRALVEDPATPGLLFAGTELGVWASLDDGGSWISIQNNLPTNPMHDLAIQPRAHDLVVGTHGRGMWVLDQIDLLSALASDAARGEGDAARGPSAPLRVFPARPGLQLNRFDRGKGNQGDAFYRAPNPPDGVILDLWIDPALVDGGAGDGAAPDAPRLEIFTIQGEPVRRLELPSGAAAGGAGGFHRVVWDTRHAPAYVGPDGDDGGDEVAGPWVLPGEYEVRLAAGGATASERVRVEGDPLYDLTAEERRTWHDARLRMARTLGSVHSARSDADALAEALEGAERALERAPGADAGLGEEVEAVAERVAGIRRGLGEVSSRLGRSYRLVQGSTAPPTADQRAILGWAERRSGELVRSLRVVTEEEAPALQRALHDAGVPWSPGRSLSVGGTGAGAGGDGS